MMPDTLERAVDQLAGRRVLVVGDVVLDEYLTGRPARISREAPVLILEETEREFRAGSAGSPAANVVALGSHATIIAAVGNDRSGEQLADGLRDLGIGCEGLILAEGVHTPTKTRILAQGYTGGLHGRQQVLRVDRVVHLEEEARLRCAAAVAEHAPSHDVVLVSDYLGGVVSTEAISAIKASRKPVAVDSQGDLRRFAGVELVKVNQAEARNALHGGDVLADGEALRRELDLRYLVVTLGGKGMALFSEDGLRVIPAMRINEVFDVTGAGDTVIAVLALALEAGLPLGTAAILANAAAGVVVRRLGVATVSPDELRAALREFTPR